MSRRPRVARITAVSISALIALGCLGWLISLDARGHEAQQHLQAARSALSVDAAADVLGGGPSDIDEPRAVLGQLTTACAETAVADNLLRDLGSQIQVASPVVDALDSVPGVGSRTRAQVSALEVGTQLAAAGTALCAGLQPLVGTTTPDTDGSMGSSDSTRGALKTVLAARPQLVVAADRLQSTLDALGNVTETDLEGSARQSLVTLRTRLRELVRTLRDTNALLG